MDHLTLSYFSEMEIPLWEARSVPQAVSLWRCLNQVENPMVGVLLYGIAPDWQVDPQDPQADLLIKILGAVNLNVSSCEVWATSGVQAEISECGWAQKPSRVLCFGGITPALAVQDEQLISLPSLADMMVDRSFKQQAWQKLKPLKDELVG